MAAGLAKLVNPIVWRIPGHGARKLFGFSLAEHGSMLDLSVAAQLAPSPERRALYLQHMLDEARHAQMFALRSAGLRLEDGQPSLGFPVADTEGLFECLGEVRFLAFVHRGESRGRQQFETYRDWFGQRGDRKTQAMFAAILKDELRHEQYTYDLLVELAGGVTQARAELRAAALWEAWRSWRRAGRFAAERLYFVLMLLIYGVSGPIALLVKGRQRAGWVEARPAVEAMPRGAPSRPAVVPQPAESVGS
jgi:hypothetical protein